MNNPATVYHYPNRMGRIILTAMDEILGRNGANAILNLASLPELIENYPPEDLNLQFSFDKIGRIQAAIEEFYGQHGGRGVSLRVGRACFQQGLRDFGPLLGLTDLAFRLLPMQTRFKVGANSFAEIFNKYSDQRVRLEDKGDVILWHIDQCPLCWGRHTAAPSCQLAVGLLQESLYWMSGGKFFNVEETQCIACGDASCTILIEKTPMG